MKMNLKVTYADESGADVVVSAPDFVAFEREFDRSVAKFESELKFTDICWLAWRRLNKQGKAGTFDEWLETIEGVEFTGSEEIVPLDKTAPLSA